MAVKNYFLFIKVSEDKNLRCNFFSARILTCNVTVFTAAYTYIYISNSNESDLPNM